MKHRLPIRLNLFFLLLLFYALFGHFLWLVLRLFAVVLLHELGHAVVAYRLGYRIESIELYPFGGVARITGKHVGWSPRDEVLISISGPLVNLVLALSTILVMILGKLSREMAEPFIEMNFTLLFFNLLPALPLDGGRIARAGLSLSRGYEAATEALTRMSLALSTLLIVFGGVALWLGYPEAGMLILGVFLLVSAISLRRQNRYDLLRFLDHKRRDSSDTKVLRTLIIDKNTEIGKVASQFVPEAYHVIYLKDKHELTNDGISTGPLIEEKEVLAAIFDGGMWMEPIHRLLQSHHHM